MTYLPYILVIAVILLAFAVKRVSNRMRELQKDFGEQIQSLKKECEEAAKQHNTDKSRIAKLEKDQSLLAERIQELEKKLNFYLNIEEDSASLNEQDEPAEKTALLEQVAQQINDQTHALQDATSESLEPPEERPAPILDHEQDAARSSMEMSSGNFFITGKAGTGKSFLLDVFRATTRKSNVVLAPTGIAALNVSGATLHSTFGYYNLVNLSIDDISKDTIRLKSEKKLILRQVETIIIDEISMVRADTFDKIDRILRVINGSNAPFGGKQVLLFGDLFQLPPIAKSQEYTYLKDRYGGIYFFYSDAYKNGDFQFIELTINHRQKDDTGYFELLNHIRDGNISVADIDSLNKRVITDESAYDRFTTLLPTRAEAERINSEHLSRLDSREYTYQAQVVLDKYPDKKHTIETIFPITETLRLRKGALVMMVANDPNYRWVNGTLGIVKELSKDSIYVAINKRTYQIHITEFTEQEASYVGGQIIYEDVLKIAQYPLVLAYAITIHKSQGQTYQNIVCDLDRCFASGQAYVALSRCTSLDGLHLKSHVNPASILVDGDVLAFYRSKTSGEIPAESKFSQ